MKKIELQVERRWSAMYDWHVVLGCTRCSPACSHCASARWLNSLKKPYLDKLIKKVQDTGKVSTLLGEDRKVPVFNGTVKLRPHSLNKPLFLPDGYQVFVAGCSDLFHDQVPFDYIKKVFAVVKECPTLVFFVITRRPDRAIEFSKQMEWPDNLWVGTSAENQKLFDQRVPLLGQIPAKYRGVSIKPMFGPVDITKHDGAFNFIIVGGQSGMGSKPMHPDWIRGVRDDCRDLSVAFQFHQWGTWGDSCGPSCTAHVWMNYDGELNISQEGTCFHRVGCKATGKVLDGEEFDEYPDTFKPSLPPGD